MRDEIERLKAELGAAKAENQSLKALAAEIGGGKGEPAATADTPKVPDPAQAVPAAKEQTPEPPAATKPKSAPTAQEKIDEELLIDLLRQSPINNSQVPDAGAETSAPVEPNFEEAIKISEKELEAVLAGAPSLIEEPVEAPEPDVVAEVSVEAEVEEVETVADEPTNDSPKLELVHEEEPVCALELDNEVVRKVPSHLAIAALAVPHRIENGKLVCKTVAPFDYPSLDLIAEASHLEIVPEPAPIVQVVAALREAYRDDSLQAEREAVWSANAEPESKKRSLFRRSA